MKRTRRTFLFFGVCAAAVLGAMAWLTVEIRTLERREAQARGQAAREAAFQEAVRRSLWRMDSFAQLFLAEEAARPHLYYNSFFSPEQAYYLTQGTRDAAWMVACAEDLRVPSPLLRAEPAFCRLHFQVVLDPVDGRPVLGSPRFPPSAENREFAINTQNVQHDSLVKAAGLMEQLKAMVRPDRLIELGRALHPSDGAGGGGSVAGAPSGGSIDPAHFARLLDERSPLPRGQTLTEWSQRRQTASQAMNVQQQLTAPLSMDAREIEVSSLNPVWLGLEGDAPELVLLRTVRIHKAVGEEEVLQGVWVDWPALRASMLGKVKDIFPDADLVPAAQTADEPERLATIPAVLRPGPHAFATAGITNTRNQVLYVAWAGVIAALLAVGVVVRAIIDLGERRGRFVSAVTHELRTPLTTFCLYSEMLADGMVRDEKAKAEYLVTLKRESQRLAKIVENVLCYARLSEVRASAHTQRVGAADLLERTVPSLARRAEEAGMSLVVDPGPAGGAMLEVDPQTVERVLINLVDNACKYAHGHVGPDGVADNRIHLSVQARGGGAGGGVGAIEFIVADHGPGIPKVHRRTVFKAFNRARTGTNATAPGLGLGLSLARGLARELRGDLRLTPLPAGFVSGTAMSLTIPAVWKARESEASLPASLRPSNAA